MWWDAIRFISVVPGCCVVPYHISITTPFFKTNNIAHLLLPLLRYIRTPVQLAVRSFHSHTSKLLVCSHVGVGGEEDGGRRKPPALDWNIIFMSIKKSIQLCRQKNDFCSSSRKPARPRSVYCFPVLDIDRPTKLVHHHPSASCVGLMRG